MSPRTAWRDFTPVEARQFGPGDRLLLKRGGQWNRQLTVRARGAPGRFVEIGAYGEGNRPHIRRDGRADQRCVRLVNPTYAKLSSLEVSNAGAGVVLYFNDSHGNRSVYVDDVVAHHFSGLYDVGGQKDQVRLSFGIGTSGAERPANGLKTVLTDLRITNCEVFHTGAGVVIGGQWTSFTRKLGSCPFQNKFRDVLLAGLNLHDQDAPNVSLTSAFIQQVDGLVFRDSVIDRGARSDAARAIREMLEVADEPRTSRRGFLEQLKKERTRLRRKYAR